MHTLYAIVAGPLAWIALVLFLGGLLFKLIATIWQAYRKERFIFSYLSLKYGLRSIVHWIVPFAASNWRQHPVLTIITFCFHISLIATPLFLCAHFILINDSWDFGWWVMPNGLSDLLTAIVIAACIFFAFRRILRREVRFVTGISDYLLLALVMAPFITGMLAYHQVGDNLWLTIVHMLTGEILLAIIPFSRLSHMILSILTRSYIGSEFGKIRRAKDW